MAKRFKLFEEFATTDSERVGSLRIRVDNDGDLQLSMDYDDELSLFLSPEQWAEVISRVQIEPEVE